MWRLFLLCNFNENKKVLKFAFVFAVLNPYPLRDVFSRAPWQLNDSPKVIWLCKDRGVPEKHLLFGERRSNEVKEVFVFTRKRLIRSLWRRERGNAAVRFRGRNYFGWNSRSLYKGYYSHLENFLIYQEHFQTLNSHLYIEQVLSFSCVHTYLGTN